MAQFKEEGQKAFAKIKSTFNIEKTDDLFTANKCFNELENLVDEFADNMIELINSERTKLKEFDSLNIVDILLSTFI